MLQIFTHANYDFVGKRRIAYAISIAFTLLGLAHIAYKGGLAAGIDFSGGTLIQVRFDQPVTVDQIRSALDRVKLGNAIIQRFGDPREYLIRTQLTGEPLEELTRRTERALAASIGKLEVRRVESVGPQVGREAFEISPHS